MSVLSEHQRHIRRPTSSNNIRSTPIFPTTPFSSSSFSREPYSSPWVPWPCCVTGNTGKSRRKIEGNWRTRRMCLTSTTNTGSPNASPAGRLQSTTRRRVSFLREGGLQVLLEELSVFGIFSSPFFFHNCEVLRWIDPFIQRYISYLMYRRTYIILKLYSI